MELLVVITIIAILIALLLPAIQAAREAARGLQCQNGLKQIGLGWLQHEHANGFLPTGGWGPNWAGEPTRGFGKRQPGGWLYNILPYIEQQALHDAGIDDEVDIARPAVRRRVMTPISLYICPTRRRAIAYPFLHSPPLVLYNVDPQPAVTGRSDYAASLGDAACDATEWDSPLTLVEGDGLTDNEWLKTKKGMVSTGVIHRRCQTTMTAIKDGASNTYLAGERYCDPDHYTDGIGLGDDQGWDSGFDFDVVRWTGITGTASDGWGGTVSLSCSPAQDTPGIDQHYSFGSAHAGGFNMALCDGSVRSIGYSIDPETHHRLGNIADGLPVDAKAF